MYNRFANSLNKPKPHSSKIFPQAPQTFEFYLSSIELFESVFPAVT